MQEKIKYLDLSEEFYIDEGCYIVEVSNSDDDPNLSIARVRVEPGVTTRLHHLKNTIERYAMLEGEGVVDVGAMLQQKLNVGDVVLIPPACPQKITNVGDTDLIFLAICTPRFKPEKYKEELET